MNPAEQVSALAETFPLRDCEVCGGSGEILPSNAEDYYAGVCWQCAACYGTGKS